MKVPATKGILQLLGLKYLREGTSEIKALCPFHKETKPSWSINKEKGVWYCFGCQAKGDLPSLVLRLHPQVHSYRQALQWLREHSYVAIPAPVISFPEFPSSSDLVESEYPLFRRRGILFCRRGRLCGRHLIPIEVDGLVVAHEARDFAGRLEPKTLPIPTHTKLTQYLYNIDDIDPEESVYIVEGTKDALHCLSEATGGLYNVVSIFGSSLTSEQRLLLHTRGVKEVILMLDADYAGIRGMSKAYAQLAPVFRTKLRLLPRGCDPADLTGEEILSMPLLEDKKDILSLFARAHLYRRP